MAAVIGITNQKGGIGKTTTALNLAGILGKKKRKTLLIDMDSQRNATYMSGIRNPEKTTTDILGGDCDIRETILQTKYYDIIPSDAYLSNAERAEGLDLHLLADAISKVKRAYDYIVIDTPPLLGQLLTMSMIASDYLIIPAEPNISTLLALDDLWNTIQKVQRDNRKLSVLGILLVKYNKRTVLSRDLKDMIETRAKTMHTRTFNATIRQSVAVQEAQTLSLPLIDHAKGNNAAIDYTGFTSEVIRLIER